MTPRVLGLLSLPFVVLGAAAPCASLDKIQQNTRKNTDGIKAPTFNLDPLKEGNAVCQKFKVNEVGFDEEVAFGGAMAVNFATGGLVVDPTKETIEPESKKKPASYKVPATAVNDGLSYLNEVGRNLGAQSPRSGLEWKFGVLADDKHVNAWSTPGGYVFVTRALMKKVQNEDQLAGVLAHEIGHVSLRHALKRYSDTKYAACMTSFYGGKVSGAVGTALEQLLKSMPLVKQDSALGKTVGGMINGASTALDLNSEKNLDVLSQATEAVVTFIVDRGYGKEDEYAADDIAAELMRSAGYSTAEYQKFLLSLPGGGAFQNHPSGRDRVEHQVKFIQGKEQEDPFFSTAAAHGPVALSERATPLR